MEKKKVIKPSKSVATVSEFEALLERYKVQSPAKYEAGVKNGSFDKFKATLIDDKKAKKEEEEPKKEPKVEKPKAKK